MEVACQPLRAFCGAFVPRDAARVDDTVVVVEQAMREMPLAQIQPDAFGRVQRRAISGQDHQADVVRRVELAGSCPPAPSITISACSSAARVALSRASKVFITRGRDCRHDEAEILAGRCLHRRQQVHPGVSLIAQAKRPLAKRPPAMARAPFLADAGFVLEPQRQVLVWMSRTGDLDRRLRPSFWKAS